MIFTARTGSVTHPKTGQAMAPKGLGGDAVAGPGDGRPAAEAGRLDGRPEEPVSSPGPSSTATGPTSSAAGVVEPMDDLRQTNPPSNPELLDALADDFVAHGYDLKHLVRTICTSRTYGLSSVPNEYNAKDKQSFARHYPKRLGAEVLLDAISQVTERADGLRRPARPAPGRSSCPTRASPRPSSTPSAGRSATPPASASG